MPPHVGHPKESATGKLATDVAITEKVMRSVGAYRYRLVGRNVLRDSAAGSGSSPDEGPGDASAIATLQREKGLPPPIEVRCAVRDEDVRASVVPRRAVSA